MTEMPHWTLKDPYWLIALLPVLIAIPWARRWRSVPVLVVPFAASWFRPGLRGNSRWPVALGYIGAVLVIIALARPQELNDTHRSSQRGYDIMLALDLSGSMLSLDYERNGERINRLEAVVPVLDAFIKKRTNDRIGLVVFAKRAYTLSPLTFDHKWLENQTNRIKIGMINPGGTAIGDGIGVSLIRLEQGSKDEKKARKGAFIVLLTDGANNAGALDPSQAAALAKAKGIPVYTIGAGRNGMVPIPVLDKNGNRIGIHYQESDLDTGALRKIAETTGGHYYRAMDSGTISEAFSAIDKAEKINFDAQSYVLTDELFPWFAIPGFILIFIATIGSLVINRREAAAT